MPASSSKGVEIWVITPRATATPITPTAASKAKPAVIDATAHGALAGNIAVLAADSTGLPTLDGKAWVVGTVNVDDFELLGSDSLLDTGTFAAGTAIAVYSAANMTKLCLSTLTVSPGGVSTISAGTFCDPSAAIASPTTEAGTIEVGGYVDISSSDYGVILQLEELGQPVWFKIDMPSNGSLLFQGTLSGLSWDIPLDGAIAWSATVTLASKPRHLF